MRDFKLSVGFLDQFVGKQPSWGPIGYVSYKRTYARMKDDGKFEEFWETCQRVVEGVYSAQKRHCKELRLPWKNEKSQRSAQEMFTRMWEFKWLPPGRGLWMMGTDYIDTAGGAALNNCFGPDTEIVYEDSRFSFDDQEGKAVRIGRIGDLAELEVVNPYVDTKTTRLSTIKCYGDQELFKVTFKVPGRSNYIQTFDVTKDHRWILSDGASTTTLSVGDRVTITPRKVVADTQDPYYSRGFCHGLIFGDGTRHTYYPERHFIRLCGSKEQKHVAILETQKEHLSTTYPKSYNGDAVVTIKLPNENWKALPDKGACHEYLQGFLAGWMAADAWTKPDGNMCLDTTNSDAADWVVKVAPVLGFTVRGWSVDDRDTNYGPRNNPLNRITLSRESTDMEVVSIDPIGVSPVYCLEVPDHHKFMLAGGIVTGNCAFVSTKGITEDFADPFAWMMDMLMLGAGVGFDTKGAGLVRVQQPEYSAADSVHVVEDTREGWVELLRRVMTAYIGKGSIPTSVDYSKVRPFGSPIKGFGGTASGPGPLIELVASVQDVLNPLISNVITSEAIVDLSNLIGRCVVSGNVRRSAEIAFGDPHDDSFLQLKDPTKHEEKLKHHRWASNNSIFADVGMDYTQVAEMTAKNGEPGYEWLENAQDYGRMGREPNYRDRRAMGGNPCLEQTLEDREMCCLVETFPSRHDSYEDYEKTLKYAYLYAKSVTLISTHDLRTNAVMMRNRRIGCSMSGITEAMAKHGRRDFFNWCDQGYNYLEALDDIYSEWLCIPRSIKKTSVKPSGTVSLLPGVTPGIHYPHAEYYIRRVRFQAGHPIVAALKLCGYTVEKDVYSPNTVVVGFPVKTDGYERSKDDVSMWEQLENAAQMQQYWADNQVSVTVTFKPEEAKHIKYALELYETRLKGVSFLPVEDHGYEQAPYETITAEHYRDMTLGLGSANLPAMLQAALEIHDIDEKYCDGGVCTVSLETLTENT